MSSINDLFGTPSSNQLQSSVSDLFKKSSGPVDAQKVKTKVRTVLPEIIKRVDKPVPELEEEEATPIYEGESGKRELEQEQNEVDERLTTLKKQKKKSKNGEDDDLEEKYYSKLLKDQVKGEDEHEVKEKEHAAKLPAVQAASSAGRQDLKEEELEKADRTVFVGNVPTDVITSKKVYKEFKSLFNTQKKTDEGVEASGAEDEKDGSKSDALAIDSIRFRSISFDEALPRKVAFMQQKLHSARDSVNAYIVYKNKSAVNQICKSLNGTVFHDHHLRTDSVAHPTKHDNKSSVFVGNLDFEEAEESLWKNFSSCGDIEYVRIVRDPKTNLGKGFAYVQFKDFQSVNKALLLDGKKINDIGRKLRVSRCKNMVKTQNFKQTNFSNRFNESQKTKLGRAKKILGRADRSTAGNHITVEGMRATKGDTTPGLKRKKQRSKTGRVTKRSTAFKKASKET